MCKEKAWNEVNEYQTCFIEFHEELHITPNSLGYLAFMTMHNLESMIEKK
jgi:hypothetical protein